MQIDPSWKFKKQGATYETKLKINDHDADYATVIGKYNSNNQGEIYSHFMLPANLEMRSETIFNKNNTNYLYEVQNNWKSGCLIAQYL